MPVKDKMYWPELARRSEKCSGPVLTSRAALGVTRMDKIRNEYIRGTAQVGRFG